MDQKNISEIKSLIKIEEGSNIIPELIKIELEEDGCLIKSDEPYCPDIQGIYNENLKMCITPADARADVNSSKTSSLWMELATQLRGRSESPGQGPRRSVIPHRCPDCLYTAKRKDQVIVQRRNHTGEKRYKCPECPYRSRRKSYLTIHHRRHTGEKPYECSKCHFRSGEKSRLVRHMKIHREKFDIKTSVAQNIKHTVLKSKSQVSTSTSTSKHQLDSEGPLFVKPLNLVKPLTLVDPPTFVNPFISKSSVLPTSYPSLFSYLPALSTMTQLAAPLIFSPGEATFTSPPTVSPTYSTKFPPPPNNEYHIPGKYSDYRA